jgi:hypothetical protein
MILLEGYRNETLPINSIDNETNEEYFRLRSNKKLNQFYELITFISSVIQE